MPIQDLRVVLPQAHFPPVYKSDLVHGRGGRHSLAKCCLACGHDPWDSLQLQPRREELGYESSWELRSNELDLDRERGP